MLSNDVTRPIGQIVVDPVKEYEPHKVSGRSTPSTPDPMGIRPALVVFNQDYNGIRHGLCIDVPITKTDQDITTHMPIEPPEGGRSKASVIMYEQLRATSRLWFRKKRGAVNQDT